MAETGGKHDVRYLRGAKANAEWLMGAFLVYKTHLNQMTHTGTSESEDGR